MPGSAFHRQAQGSHSARDLLQQRCKLKFAQLLASNCRFCDTMATGSTGSSGMEESLLEFGTSEDAQASPMDFSKAFSLWPLNTNGGYRYVMVQYDGRCIRTYN